MVDSKALIASWRDDLDGQNYVATPRVQDRLLSLWGEVGDDGTRLIEEWLALTPHRQLFTAAELRDLLDEVEALLNGEPQPA